MAIGDTLIISGRMWQRQHYHHDKTCKGDECDLRMPVKQATGKARHCRKRSSGELKRIMKGDNDV